MADLIITKEVKELAEELAHTPKEKRDKIDGFLAGVTAFIKVENAQQAVLRK